MKANQVWHNPAALGAFAEVAKHTNQAGLLDAEQEVPVV